MLLDYVILIAVTAFSATNYLARLPRTGSTPGRRSCCCASRSSATSRCATSAASRATRANRITALVLADIALQVVLIVLGLILFFDLHALIDPIDLGTTPQWDDLIFASALAAVVFTGLESASGLAGEVGGGPRRAEAADRQRVGDDHGRLRRDRVVAVTALPVRGNETSLSRNYLEAPMLGIAESFPQHWLRDTLKYVVAAGGRGDADRRRATRRCSGSRGWPTRWRPTARSRARSGGCTRRARRRSC